MCLNLEEHFGNRSDVETIAIRQVVYVQAVHYSNLQLRNGKGEGWHIAQTYSTAAVDGLLPVQLTTSVQGQAAVAP